ALDLNCERLEGIPDPADFELLSIERACLDGAAIVVRHDLAVFVAAPDQRAFVGKGGRTGRVAGSHEIVWTPVEWHVKFRIGKARTLDDRLVIAGQKPLRFAEPRDLHRAKIILEEAARGLLVGGPRRSRAPADLPERAVDRPVVVRAFGVAKGLAARLESRERGKVIVGRPAVDINPFDRLELAVRELQRAG